MSETREPELDKPNCAPGRNRTYDTRFRKPVLYPLSYEGGACINRGRKPVAELRSSFGTSILAAGPGRSAGGFGPRESSGPVERLEACFGRFGWQGGRR